MKEDAKLMPTSICESLTPRPRWSVSFIIYSNQWLNARPPTNRPQEKETKRKVYLFMQPQGKRFTWLACAIRVETTQQRLRSVEMRRHFGSFLTQIDVDIRFQTHEIYFLVVVVLFYWKSLNRVEKAMHNNNKPNAYVCHTIKSFRIMGCSVAVFGAESTMVFMWDNGQMLYTILSLGFSQFGDV